MKTRLPLSFVGLSLVGVSLVGVGCFDEPQPSATTAASTAGDDDASTASTEPDPTGAVDETAAGETVTVRGVVTSSFVDSTAVPGVKVELVGDPSVSAITGADGRFELPGVPAGTPAFVATSASSTYVGTVLGIDLMFADVEITVPQYTRAEAMSAQASLMAQGDAEPYDPARGAIFAVSTHANTSIELNPMPPNGTYYSLDTGGMAVLDSNVPTFVLAPAVVFYNLPPGPPGMVEVSASHPQRTCTVPLSEPPVLPDHATFVSVGCI